MNLSATECFFTYTFRLCSASQHRGEVMTSQERLVKNTMPGLVCKRNTLPWLAQRWKVIEMHNLSGLPPPCKNFPVASEDWHDASSCPFKSYWQSSPFSCISTTTLACFNNSCARLTGHHGLIEFHYMQSHLLSCLCCRRRVQVIPF